MPGIFFRIRYQRLAGPGKCHAEDKSSGRRAAKLPCCADESRLSSRPTSRSDNQRRIMHADRRCWPPGPNLDAGRAAGLGPRTGPDTPCPGPLQPDGQAGSPRAAAGDPVTRAHVRGLLLPGEVLPGRPPRASQASLCTNLWMTCANHSGICAQRGDNAGDSRAAAPVPAPSPG